MTIKQAAFRDADGKVLATGPIHDISALPLDFKVVDEGFVDERGNFMTRDEATAQVHADHPVESEELHLAKSLGEYDFADKPEKIGTDYVFKAFRAGQPVGHVAIASKPHSVHTGYHMIQSANVHPEHRGAGVYGRLLHLASSYIKKHGGKGVYSPSEWRFEAASGAWEKLATKMPIKSKTGLEGKDFFLHEHDDETELGNLEHEFEVEFKRWMEARLKGLPYDPPSLFNFTKAENALHQLVARHGNLKNAPSDVHHEIARQMAGYDPDASPEFSAARFLAGGEAATGDAVRTSLILYDNDFELAALRAYGLPRNEHYREMIRSVVAMLAHVTVQHDKPDDKLPISEQGFGKSEGELDTSIIPRDIKAANKDAEETAESVRRAQAASNIHSVQFDKEAKHSKGTAIATDPETDERWLLKPGSGKHSPAAGVRDELASQSQREVAFAKIVEAVGLSEFYPDAELLLVDGKQVAALVLLDTEFNGLDKIRQSGALDPTKLFSKYVADGTLYRWALMDWILGNPDRHANNVMVNEAHNDVKLIDHGSAFAGQSFDPAHDPKSFTPFYLRAWSDKNWSDLDEDHRFKAIPSLTATRAREFGEWLDTINEHQIAQIMAEYGIAPEATIERLKDIRSVDVPQRAEQLIRYWSGLLT